MVVTYGHMQSKEDILKESLLVFYQDNRHMRILSDILLNKMLSLRIIDYFVTTYSKVNNTSYKVNNKHFNVFIQYKSLLKGFSKKFFDVFARRERMTIFSQTHDCDISTTIAQLHFFKWSISNNIIDYCLNHMREIESHMGLTSHIRTKALKSSSQKKYTTKAVTQRGITKKRILITLNFE
jgi:DNA-binding MarR family transcriptional regulator